jgi:hypothetical protein
VAVHQKPQPAIVRNGLQLQTSNSFLSYQWFYDNQEIPGATSSTYNAAFNGGYFVEVKDSNGCVNRANVVLIDNVGIHNLAGVNYVVNIYPNPAQDIVHIDAPVALNVVVRDLQSKTVVQAENTNQLDLSGIATGVYILSVYDKDGQLLKIEKLVKGN